MSTVSVYLPSPGTIPGIPGSYGPGEYSVDYSARTATFVSSIPTGQQVFTVTRGATTYLVAASNASTQSKVSADYLCTGTNDDQVIMSALNALPSAGGRVVLSEGTFTAGGTITLNTGQWLEGMGYQSTVIQLANSANVDLVQTTNFGSLTGTNTASTPYNLGIQGLTLDGNKSNNASGGNCLSIYAYGYTLHDIRARNANNYGVWTEWGTQSSSPGNDSMEAFVTDFKIHDNKTGGVFFKGPHDSQWHNGIIYNNGNGTGTYSVNIPTDQYGSGSVFSMIHVWGGNYDYGFRINCTGITLADCQIEGSLLAEVWVGANNCNLFNCKLFSLEPLLVSNAVKGILMASSAVNLCVTGCKCENLGGGVLDVTSSGGDNYFEAFAVYYTVSINVPSPAIIGSVDAQSTIILHMLNTSGITTSSSTLTWPGAFKNPSLQVAGSYAGGVGINTGPNSSDALLIDPGANANRGLVLFPHSGSQSAALFAAQNSSFVDQFLLNASGNMVVQSGGSTFYSGSGVPSNGNGTNGDYYFRTDTPGTANQRIYVKSAGSWSGIV